MLPIVDVSDNSMAASGTTKRISINNILACSPSATLASATITGNLTVRTNALTVDANNNVGIGTTAPTVYTNYRTLAIVGGSTGGVIDINPSGGVTAGGLQIGSTAAATNIDAFGPSAGTAAPLVLRTGTFGSVAERYRVAGDGVATWSNVGGVAGTAMTLNSTGLFLGATAQAFGEKFRVYGAYTVMDDGAFTGFLGKASGLGVSGATTDFAIRSSNALIFLAGGATERMRIDSSGNVGVGVTPSATDSTYYQALEITRVGQGLTGAKNALTSSPNSWLSNNSYATYSAGIVWKYAVSQPAAQYRLLDASHQWYRSTDVTPTAGNAITFTQAMTLNAAGSLVLGAAAVATTATDGFLYIPGCAGTPTGTPTAQTGRVPLVVDTTNNKLYFYSGGSWVAAN
jgi:hypothetical protein